MSIYLEVWGSAGPHLVPLDAERVTVGRGASNDVSVPTDPMMSRLHAVFERVGTGWCLKDLSSHNGTFVNGKRIWADRPLRAGDDIRMGRTRLVYRVEGGVDDVTATQAAQRAPDLTRREREVLTALCRPVLSGDVFTEPAAIRQIAAELVVTEAAIKQHLLRLYDKFGIHEQGERRRVQLANEAVRRGAVTFADLTGSSRTS